MRDGIVPQQKLIMPGLIFDLNNQAHNNADQKRERNGQHFQIGTDFGCQFPSGYMIVTRKKIVANNI